MSKSVIELWNYYRSGTSHRVRIALNLKGIEWTYRPLNLLKSEHKSAQYLHINPQGLAPTMLVDGVPLTQSPAILEYIEEMWPHPPLLPKNPMDRAKVRAMAMIIGCDIHPINNLRILNEVKAATGEDGPPLSWIHKWIQQGFEALESMLFSDKNRDPGFCFGSAHGLIECYLIPQIYAARRFEFDLSPFPLICQIDEHCARLPAFIDAHPDQQPDAPDNLS